MSALDPNQLFHSVLAMNALFASLAWCLARPNWASIPSVLVLAVLWPLVNKPLEGSILLPLSDNHGITESDLLSVLAVLVAAVQAVRRVKAHVSAKRPTDASRPPLVDAAAPARLYRHQPRFDRYPRAASAHGSSTLAGSAPSADRSSTVPVPLGDPRRRRVLLSGATPRRSA